MACDGLKRTGYPCTFKRRKGSDFCGIHQPTDMTRVPQSVDSMATRRLPSEIYWSALHLLAVHDINFVLVPDNNHFTGEWSWCPSTSVRHEIKVVDSLYGVNFLETFIHEVAHATTWDLYGRDATPHGKEWKAEYRRLMKPFLSNPTLTSDDLEMLSNPGTKKHVTVESMKKKFPTATFICELNVGGVFTYRGNMYTVKNRGRGVNYICTLTDNRLTGCWKFPKFTRIEI